MTVKVNPIVPHSENDLKKWIKQFGIRVCNEKGNQWKTFRPAREESIFSPLEDIIDGLFGSTIIKSTEKQLGRVDLVQVYKTKIYFFELKINKATTKDFSQAFSYFSYYESLKRLCKQKGYKQKGYNLTCYTCLVAPDFENKGAWVIPPKYENNIIPIQYDIKWTKTLGKNNYRLDPPIRGVVKPIREMKNEIMPGYINLT